MQRGTGDTERCCCNPWVPFSFAVPPGELAQPADKAKQMLLQAALLPSAQDRKTKANAPQESLYEENFL